MMTLRRVVLFWIFCGVTLSFVFALAPRTDSNVHQLYAPSKEFLLAQARGENVQEFLLKDYFTKEGIRLDLSDSVTDYLSGKTVIVFGGGGVRSIGSEAVRQMLRSKAKRIVVVDVNENGLYELQARWELEERDKTGHPELICELTNMQEDRKSTRLNSSHSDRSRMPSSA